MRTIFNKIAFGILSIGVTVFIFTSCSDDIILEPLDSLSGNYEGQYILTDLSTDQEKVNVPIDWIFSELGYRLTDTTGEICSPGGDYTLNGDKVNLEQKDDGNVGTVCDSDLNPLGEFSLRRPGDSLYIEQIENQIHIEIRLKSLD